MDELRRCGFIERSLATVPVERSMRLETGDTTVFFRGSDVIGAGDLFDMIKYPVIDRKRRGSLEEILKTLNHGVPCLILTTAADDPEYPNDTLITSEQFKYEPDGSKWKPSPCKAK